MGIGKSKAKSASRGQPTARSSAFGLWHLAFFLAGALCTGLGQILLGGSHPGPGGATRHPTFPDPSRSKPWGNLEITPIVLDRPEDFLDEPAAPAPEIRWFFPGYPPARVAELFQASELTSTERASLLETNRWLAEARGCIVVPELSVVQSLNRAARARIYAVLAQSPLNPSQHFPFVCPADRFDGWFTGCELPPDKLALVRRLSYPRGALLHFADSQLFELTSSSNETRCLMKALSRVPSLMMHVRLTADSNIDALLDYWGRARSGRNLKPLLKSLAQVHGGWSLNIAHFLPPIPRQRLYTFPNPTNGVREDCFWTAFNFFNDQPDYHFDDPEYPNKLLQSEYVPVTGEKRLGDLMLLFDADGNAAHVCVYIAEDVVFTKNGGDVRQPWVLMRFGDMMMLYESERAQQWRVFRRTES